MSPIVRQRARLARVRKVQHNLAAVRVARAQGEVTMLETSADQLSRIRHGLGFEQGTALGASLASLGELAMRLDAARDGIGRSIANARQIVAAHESSRIVAHRNQESAERLQERATAIEARRAERRGVIARRRPSTNGDVK